MCRRSCAGVLGGYEGELQDGHQDDRAAGAGGPVVGGRGGRAGPALGRTFALPSLCLFLFSRHFSFVLSFVLSLSGGQGSRRLGCPSMTQCSWGRGMVIYIKSRRCLPGSSKPLPWPSGPHVAGYRQTNTNILCHINTAKITVANLIEPKVWPLCTQGMAGSMDGLDPPLAPNRPHLKDRICKTDDDRC